MKETLGHHPDLKKDFETLYNENFARVNRYLRYRVKNTWDADDLTTLVFIKALEKFNTYRGGEFVFFLDTPHCTQCLC